MKLLVLATLGLILAGSFLMLGMTTMVLSQTNPVLGGGYVRVWVYGFNMYDEWVPISWAQVTATSGQLTFRAASARDGGYEMFLPVGTYNLTVAAPGYTSTSTPLSVSNGSAGPVNFYLEQSKVPIPEFLPGTMSILMIVALFATLLARKATRRKK